MPSSLYKNIIMETLNCDETKAQAIEDIMRYDIYSGTLDWQTREMLEDAAREAEKIFAEINQT